MELFWERLVADWQTLVDISHEHPLVGIAFLILVFSHPWYRAACGSVGVVLAGALWLLAWPFVQLITWRERHRGECHD